MVVRKSSFIILLLMTSACATAQNQVSVRINNHLSKCVSINETHTDTADVIPILSFDLKLKKTIGECGCKSALGSFYVYSKMDGYQSFIIGGKIPLLTPGLKHIPLSAEQKLISGREVEVVFSCARPD